MSWNECEARKAAAALAAANPRLEARRRTANVVTRWPSGDQVGHERAARRPVHLGGARRPRTPSPRWPRSVSIWERAMSDAELRSIELMIVMLRPSRSARSPPRPAAPGPRRRRRRPRPYRPAPPRTRAAGSGTAPGTGRRSSPKRLMNTPTVRNQAVPGISRMFRRRVYSSSVWLLAHTDPPEPSPRRNRSYTAACAAAFNALVNIGRGTPDPKGCRRPAGRLAPSTEPATCLEC